MVWLRDRLPDDAIVTSDAGNFSGWPNRFLQYRRPGRQLGPTSGAMGYGVPAAVAAKLVHPDRLVVGFCGDGGFMMTGQELATSMLEGVGPDYFGLQQRDVRHDTHASGAPLPRPGRRDGIEKPRFPRASPGPTACLAPRSARTEEFAAGLRGSGRRKGAAIIELKIDPEMITTRTTLSEIRRQAEARQRRAEA